MTEITDYNQQAIDFLTISNTAFSAKYIKTGKYFDDDKEERDIYEITLSSKGRSYTFKFGNSINASGQYILLDSTLKKRFGRPVISSVEYKKLSFYDKKEVTINKNFKAPTAYDVLACIAKYDPGTLDDFCSEFGYDVDSKKAEKIYNAVKEEWLNIERLFTESEMDILRDIS